MIQANHGNAVDTPSQTLSQNADESVALIRKGFGVSTSNQNRPEIRDNLRHHCLRDHRRVGAEIASVAGEPSTRRQIVTVSHILQMQLIRSANLKAGWSTQERTMKTELLCCSRDRGISVITQPLATMCDGRTPQPACSYFLPLPRSPIALTPI